MYTLKVCPSSCILLGRSVFVRRHRYQYNEIWRGFVVSANLRNSPQNLRNKTAGKTVKASARRKLPGPAAGIVLERVLHGAAAPRVPDAGVRGGLRGMYM